MLRITVPQKCDESGFRSLPNARIPWATRKCYVFLILFAEDVDPNKVRVTVRRRYQWSRSGAQGLCERCPRCIKVLPQFGMRGVWLRHFFKMQVCIPPQFKVRTTQRCILVVRTEMRAVPAKIELRTRSMSHLLSSVDPVLYCDSLL